MLLTQQSASTNDPPSANALLLLTQRSRPNFTASHKLICDSFSHMLARFNHYLIFSRFLFSSTFSSPKPLAGRVPDLMSACPQQCQGGLTCSLPHQRTIYPAGSSLFYATGLHIHVVDPCVLSQYGPRGQGSSKFDVQESMCWHYNLAYVYNTLHVSLFVLGR